MSVNCSLEETKEVESKRQGGGDGLSRGNTEILREKSENGATEDK